VAGHLFGSIIKPLKGMQQAVYGSGHMLGSSLKLASLCCLVICHAVLLHTLAVVGCRPPVLVA
jgi:hypothetical protein